MTTKVNLIETGSQEASILSTTGQESLNPFGLQLFHVRETQPSGTNGGTNVTATWTKRVLNTEIQTGVSWGSINVSTGVITLDTGTYYVEGISSINRSNATKIRLRDTTGSSTSAIGLNSFGSNGNSGMAEAMCDGQFTLSVQSDMELQYYSATSRASDGLGVAASSGELEVYADVKIWKLS